MLRYALTSGWTSLMLGLFSLTVCGNPSVPVGARQMGMGETFTGVADDGNAIFYNPAGLSRLESYGFSGMHAQLYGLGTGFFHEDGQNSLSVIIPAAKHMAVGLGYESLDILDDALDFSQRRITVPLSWTRENLSIGVNMKFFQMKTSLDQMQIGYSTSSSPSFDIGLLLHHSFLPVPWSHRFQLGIMVSDLLGGTIKHRTGVEEQMFPRIYRLGFSYDFIKNGQRSWLVACDIDNERLHLGSEYSPYPLFVLRGGIQWDLPLEETPAKEPPTFSLGATVKFGREGDGRNAALHAAYVHYPTLPSSIYVSASLNLPQKSFLKIVAVQFKPLYPALLYAYRRFNPEPQTVVIPQRNPFELVEAALVREYQGQVQVQRRNDPVWRKITRGMTLQARDKLRWDDAFSSLQLQQEGSTVLYASLGIEPSLTQEDTIGRILLENRDEKPLRVRMFLQIQDIGEEHPITPFVTLPPKAQVSLPLRQIVFQDSMLERTENTTYPVHIRVASFNPDTVKEMRENETDESITTYSRNDIVWDDVRKIGAFINPQDPTVGAFSNTLLEHSKSDIRHTPINKNVYKAILIFNALRAFGIRPNTDSNHPEFGVDAIKYPFEMLHAAAQGGQQRLGDCDDSVSLFCSSLEAIGIHTAVIELPNHLLMAFDTGIPMEDIGYESERRASVEAISSKEYSSGEETAWIPVETTLLEFGFDAAWKGALKLLTERRESAREDELPYQPVILQGGAWEAYLPVNVPRDTARESQRVLDHLYQVLKQLPDTIQENDKEAIQWFTFQSRSLP